MLLRCVRTSTIKWSDFTLVVLGIAPKLAGNTKGVYLFSIATGSDETIVGVGITIGVGVVDGGVEGVV